MALGKVSKRVNLTLPDEIFDALERWADQQGRPTANLAAFLVETSIRDALERQVIAPKTKKQGGDRQ